MSLRPNVTIKSHDHEKEGHFSNCRGISIHLPLARVVRVSSHQGNYPFTYLMTLIVYEVNLLKG